MMSCVVVTRRKLASAFEIPKLMSREMTWPLWDTAVIEWVSIISHVLSLMCEWPALLCYCITLDVRVPERVSEWSLLWVNDI